MGTAEGGTMTGGRRVGMAEGRLMHRLPRLEDVATSESSLSWSLTALLGPTLLSVPNLTLTLPDCRYLCYSRDRSRSPARGDKSGPGMRY